MRSSLLILVAALAASPAAAAQQAPSAPAPAQTVDTSEAEAILADPATADRLTGMMKALSKAFLALPVGELQAAAEGRTPTAEEKGLTVADSGRKTDPNFERDVERRIAASKPMIESSMKALANALPAMMRGVASARTEIERATANIPRPDYPKR